MNRSQDLADSLLRQHCPENKGGEKQVSWVTPDQGGLSKMKRSHAIRGHFLGNVFAGNPSCGGAIAGKAVGGEDAGYLYYSTFIWGFEGFIGNLLPLSFHVKETEACKMSKDEVLRG